MQGKYHEALDVWVQAFIRDHRVGHPDRQSLKERMDALVFEHDLRDDLDELRKQYGMLG